MTVGLPRIDRLWLGPARTVILYDVNLRNGTYLAAQAQGLVPYDFIVGSS